MQPVDPTCPRTACGRAWRRPRAGSPASGAITPPPTSSGSPAASACATRSPKWARSRLWHLLKTEPFVNTLGALTGNQAMQQVKAGLKAIYLSGWQVAADANTAGEMYPDQSLYPVDSVPKVVRRINNALRRADQIAQMEGDSTAILDGADRRRRRGRVRRRAERLSS